VALDEQPRIEYAPPPEEPGPAVYLVAVGRASNGGSFPFYRQVEIGRFTEARQGEGGVLLVRDAKVSRSHCILMRDADGRCFLRDTSRNGTWLDGRRLVPGIDVEVRSGQEIVLTDEVALRFEGGPDREERSDPESEYETVATTGLRGATVLVGDIRDYTVLVRTVDSARLQPSVSRVFSVLEREILSLGGTVKEYQGDAVVAFWEQVPGENQAVAACHAALALDARARAVAEDRSVWDVPGSGLRMDWALATGFVVIKSVGGARPVGLSMIGEPVVLAFRIEKAASDATGPVVVCPTTARMAAQAFCFDDLGEFDLKGFDKPQRVYALRGPKEDAAPSPGTESTSTGER